MTSQLRKINNVIEQFLLPLAEAVSGWSTLAAIRSALIVTLPLMFLGSLAELLISFPLDAYKEFMFRQFGPEWRMFGQILKDATFSVMSLIMVFSIGHHLADQFNHDNPVLRANPVIAGLVAFTAFFCLLQQDGDALNRRWLGGMLTNFVTIRSRINRMEELEAMVEDGRMAVLPKKEQAVLGKELTKLQTNLGGARDMKGLPQALFVIDTKREENAIKEAQRLNIPVVALIDTNSDPDEVEYGIPCNDDAISAVTLMCELMADACLAGSGKEQVSEAEMAAEPKAE